MIVRTLDNIFDKSSRRSFEVSGGGSLLSHCPESYLKDPGLTIVHRGRTISREVAERIPARKGDEVIFYRVPLGLSVGAILTYLAVSLIVSAVVAGISYAIAALTAPSARSKRDRELDDSPIYGFDAIANTVRPGTRIPIIYGKHRFGGHIIQQFQREARDANPEDTGPKSSELNTLLGVCTGPISGLEDIRIDGNPATDFEGVQIETRMGGNYQAPILGFNDVVTTVPKDAALVATQGPVNFTTQDKVDAFELIVRFTGGLFRVSDTGQFRQKSVEVKIEYQEVGKTTWLDAGTKTIAARTSNPFDVFLTSPRLDRGFYSIRVTRLTPDDTSATGFSDMTVIGINEILEETLSYPRVALLGVRQLPTNQVSGAPPIYDALVTGKLVRVFTDPTTYTEEWSDNPAWCLLDLLTNSFDGLGAFIDDNRVDIQSFIDWAAFCDEIVPIDDAGGTEKRFRLNLVLEGSITAIEAIRQICTTGRAFFLLKGNKWAIRIDQEEEPVQLFTMGRINRDSFTVQREGKEDRANYFLGEFWNEDLDFQQDVLPREDPTLQALDEQVETSINLLGSTKTSQVARLLNYFMLSNRLLRRHVEFEAGAEALAIEAGDVFLIAHDVPGWGFSGKLLEVNDSGQELIMDRELTIEAGKTYEVTVVHADDTVDVASVINNPETTRRIVTAGDFTQTPAVGAHYSFGEVTKSTVKYRCLSISKGSKLYKRRIRAQEYNPAIYGDDLTVLPPPSVSRLPNPNTIPPPVTDLRLLERQAYAEDGTLSVAIDVFFTLPQVSGVRATVFWREQGDTLWEEVGTVRVGSFSITENVESPGHTYEVSVVTVSQNGQRVSPSQGVQGTITTVGTTRQPDIVVDFRVDRTAAGLIFSWAPVDPTKNFDLAYYEVRQGPAWDSAVLIGRTSTTTLETTSVVQGTNTYFIKAFNTAGKESATATAVIISIDGRIGENVVLTRQEEPAWSGTKQSVSVDSGKLVLDTTNELVAWRAALASDPVSAGSFLPGGRRSIEFQVTGIYTSDKFQITSGNAVRAFIATLLEVDAIDTTLTWAAFGTETWEGQLARGRTWGSSPEGKAKTKVEMRFSANSQNEEDFGAWQERPTNIEATVKWAQLRLTLQVLDPAFTIQVTKFHVLFDVPDITEGGEVTTSASGSVAVTYTKTFNNAPKVTATVIGATEGDEIFLTNKTNTGFDVNVQNASTFVVRTVNYNAIGF